mmetsp:Transcript_5325/g.7538  ORF Transcript_5325/g.7538 Transcript_5325/m.7538 type:complete len:124 (+) Transcript_5325:192-563(+)
MERVLKKKRSTDSNSFGAAESNMTIFACCQVNLVHWLDEHQLLIISKFCCCMSIKEIDSGITSRFHDVLVGNKQQLSNDSSVRPSRWDIWRCMYVWTKGTSLYKVTHPHEDADEVRGRQVAWG